MRILYKGPSSFILKKEKYLGNYLTNENSLQRSIELHIEERAVNVIVKLRNLFNTPKSFLSMFLQCNTQQLQDVGPMDS